MCEALVREQRANSRELGAVDLAGRACATQSASDAGLALVFPEWQRPPSRARLPLLVAEPLARTRPRHAARPSARRAGNRYPLCPWRQRVRTDAICGVRAWLPHKAVACPLRDCAQLRFPTDIS